ncbi:tRNA 5-methoxyuridine(34)/uridine 5-oxyacetic acid(34) synthase CmoB [Hydrogenimonas cancrithermarum]|uniref:tRNA U34 carboxymethyltransferase n=1 Tax=Hydrogenimonas cancrithermarum TaxID=2993563 RepID=A0ABN6WT63_9BACT|nr:tRNA 5-methoxyuridine(34)/uridine 5-oxyacetic acid(34) synthase CmoB [Hydrogenimonas cancrithermarum]BDY12138.1 tRNA U34 carboxymethyltransferase [Hydrogenimonas cancrithermarum]
MKIEEIIKERESWLRWKNVAPIRDAMKDLPQIKDAEVELGDWIRLRSDSVTPEQRSVIYEVAKKMMPWRKGPFDLFGIRIDSEWQSFRKYNLLRPYMDLEGKMVADVGCNNGYYMFRMLEFSPKLVLGVDPSPIFRSQFDLINRYVRSDRLRYEMLGIEHMAGFADMFDTLFCLGVLYHRSDPIVALKSLKRSLKKGGELILDTFMIEGEEPVCLVPESTYSKISNVHFVPTVPALENWCKKAGFERFEVLDIVKTEPEEQRKTEWMEGQSLEEFLDPDNPDLTIEGYPAPRRVYVRCYRK